MKSLTELIRTIPNVGTTESGCDYRAFQQSVIDRENARVGNLTGIDCPKCRNKGIILFLRGTECVQAECSCMKTRRSMRRIEESGLAHVLEISTFDSFVVECEWQSKLKQTAQHYVEAGEGKWLLFGGQPGCGKTHLCTAVVGKLLAAKKSAKYMMWRDEATRIKALVNDEEAYGKAIDVLKNVDVLYIDDFFKGRRGDQPTQADINLAFQILNYRYLNKKMTIISTEKNTDDLLNIDEAIGSRIIEMSKGFCINIGNDRSKNFRLYD